MGAERALGIGSGNISKAVWGERKQAGGYEFRPCQTGVVPLLQDEVWKRLDECSYRNSNE